MLIIGFGHRARQGKNSAAVAFINAAPLGKEVRLYAYADSLRAEVTRAINVAGGLQDFIEKGQISVTPFCVDSQCLGDCGLPAKPTPLPDWVKADAGKPRTLLQWWGTDYRRAQDPNYWVKQFEERLKKDNPDIALLTDVRFPNEVDAIHAAGGYVVKVTRTTAPDVEVPAHPSENALDSYTGWDYEIKAANLDELKKQAVAIYKRVAR
jgi:hypothetical protein